jgi:hypothetical protein
VPQIAAHYAWWLRIQSRNSAINSQHQPSRALQVTCRVRRLVSDRASVVRQRRDVQHNLPRFRMFLFNLISSFLICLRELVLILNVGFNKQFRFRCHRCRRQYVVLCVPMCFTPTALHCPGLGIWFVIPPQVLT